VAYRKKTAFLLEKAYNKAPGLWNALFTISALVFSLFYASAFVRGATERNIRGESAKNYSIALCLFIIIAAVLLFLHFKKRIVKSAISKATIEGIAFSAVLGCFGAHRSAESFYRTFFSKIVHGKGHPRLVKAVYDLIPASISIKNTVINYGTVFLGLISVFAYFIILLALYNIVLENAGILIFKRCLRCPGNPDIIISRKQALANLKSNLGFIVSSFAFYSLYLREKLYIFFSLLIAVTAVVFTAALIPDIYKTAKTSVSVKIVSALSAAGACAKAGQIAYSYFRTSGKLAALASLLGVQASAIVLILAVLGAAAAFWFIFTLLNHFFAWFLPILNNILSGISKAEAITITVIVLLLLAFSTYAFNISDAFYGSEANYDVIYTSDSGELVKNHSYLHLTFHENDIRQALFAVCSAPFIGLPHLLSYALPFIPNANALLVNYAQLLLLILSYFMLLKLLDIKSPFGRVCFLIMISSMNATILFSVMMEQYIISLFWLILFIYLALNKHEGSLVALIGAGGTLMTSASLFPFMLGDEELRSPRAIFRRLISFASIGVLALAFFGRFDVLLNNKSNFNMLTGFAGSGTSLLSRLFQYLIFVPSCFFSPDSGMKFVSFVSAYHISWQLVPADSVDYAGIIILFICALGYFLSRKNRISQVCAAWIIVSLLVLWILGWGTMENGLILYCLYFGWAFLILIYRFVEYILTKLNLQILMPAFMLLFSVFMLVLNIQGMSEIIRFAAKFYPL
jgi:hypothetical protein